MAMIAPLTSSDRSRQITPQVSSRLVSSSMVFSDALSHCSFFCVPGRTTVESADRRRRSHQAATFNRSNGRCWTDDVRLLKVIMLPSFKDHIKKKINNTFVCYQSSSVKTRTRFCRLCAPDRIPFADAIMRKRQYRGYYKYLLLLHRPPSNIDKNRRLYRENV